MIGNLNKIKKLVLIILEREIQSNKNQTLFYIYHDGTVEKQIIIE